MAAPARSESINTTEIGIDGGTWGNHRGYGRFLRQLLPELVRLRPDWRFTVFLDQSQEDIVSAPNLHWRVARTQTSVSQSARADSARSAPDLLRMSWAVTRQRLNLLFFPTVYSYFPVVGRFPVVVGIHDTMADRHPEWAFAGKAQQLLWNSKVRLALAQASRIVTVSEYSRQSIASHFAVNASRIAVLSEGAASIFAPTGATEEQFILAVGGISPNKNLSVLIEALAELRRDHPDLRLVLVGDYLRDGFRSSFERLVQEAAAHGISDAVRFTGYLPDEELVALYNRCLVFAMPSLEEGFGLPLVEAMACGCACVVADGHALREVGGDAVLRANPLSTGEWSSTIAKVIDDAKLRQTLRQKAVQRSLHYSWERGAATLIEVFEELLTK